METATTTEPTIDPRSDELRLGASGTRMIVTGIVLAVVGGGAACTLALRTAEPRSLLFHAYLVAFTFYLTITLGALFFVMLHHLCRAGWSVTLRRIAEALSGNVGLMAVLLIPLMLGIGELYEWSHPEAVAHDPLLAGKSVYLSPTSMLLRFVLYFAVWGTLAWYLRSRSIRQDQSGDYRLSTAMERVSAPGMIALALTMTFAAIDLLMSLNPDWYSTIFGVYFFGDCVLSGLIVVTLAALWLQATGHIGRAITTEHYHDLGKLTFAFVFFWGYIAFSQYLLIWYANMPEETQFYLPRQLGPWAAVSVALVACHLLIPFVGLLSRHAKRRLVVFTFWAIWLLGAQLLDLFWLVMPHMFIREIPRAVGTPDAPLSQALAQLVVSSQSVYTVAPAHQAFMQSVCAPLEPASVAVVLGLTIALGGLFLANTARLLQGAALVPLQDPRIAESLAFKNV